MSMEWVAILVTIVLAWSALLVGAVKWLLDRNQTHVDTRFESLEKAIAEEAKHYQRLERELLQLRADLPLQYMRREDAIRQEVVINAKLDALAAKIDNLRLRGTTNGS